jgi:hypothetical protein
MKILKIISCLLLLYALGISCSSEEKECTSNNGLIQQPINPNGDSELALLMRAMYDEAELIKQQIDKGEPITVSLDYEALLTAEATEPEKAASDTYQSFSKTHIRAMKALQNASPAKQLDIYDTMVGNCMSCHKALCPGPMVKIKKLQ